MNPSAMPHRSNSKNIVLWILLSVSLLLNLVLLTRTGKNPEKVPDPAAAASSVPEKPAPLMLEKSEFYDWSDMISLRFSRTLHSVPGRVEITPRTAELSVRNCGRELQLCGKFAPETVYTITVRAGLAAADGGKLERDAVSVIRTPKLSPDMEFLTSGPYLPLHGNRMLAARFRNVRRVRCTLSKYFANNLNMFSLEDYQARSSLKKIAGWEETLDFPRNRYFAREIRLDRVLPDNTPGVYLLEIRDAGSSASASRPVVLSDLSIQAACNENTRQCAVAIRRFSDGKPVPGAIVRLTSRKNQFAGTGTTGQDGTCVIPFDAAFDSQDDPVNSLIATAGNDLTYFVLEPENRLDRTADGRVITAGPRAFVCTGRGIFRPGETVNASAFVRTPEPGKLVPAVNVPAVLELVDPNGKTVQKTAGKTDADGMMTAAFRLGDTAATGRYGIVCKIADAPCGETSILAGTFVPDRLKVTVKPLENGPFDLTQNIDFQIFANYYFGPEVTEGEFKGNFLSCPAAAPAHWQGWTAGGGDFAAFDQKVKPVLQNGKRGFRYAGDHEKVFVPVRLLAEASAAEPGGRAVSGSAEVILLPTPDFIGLRQQETHSPDAVFDYTLLNFLKSRPVPQQRGAWQVTLEKSEWDCVFNTRSGRREWQQLKRDCPEYARRLTAGRASGTIRLAKLPAGNYILTVADEAGLRKTSLEFWHAAGSGTVRSASPLALDMALDKPLYQAGDTAELRFHVPFAGYICAVYGERGIDRMVQFPVRAGQNVLKVPVPATLGDRYFAGVTFEGVHDGKRLRTFGAAAIPVDRKAVRLAVAVNVPETVRPGEQAAAKVTLRDAAGKPASGTVQLFVTDPGILSLTNFKTPDIAGFFWSGYRSGTAYYDLFARIYPELKILPDGQIAGDGGLAGMTGKALFRHLKPAALVLPPVRVPASGTVTIPFAVPEHQGALRLMAVASNADAAGSGEAETIVREAAECLLHVPRAAAPGDEFECTFNVFRFDTPSEDMQLEISGLKNAIFKTKIPKGASRSFTVRMKAETPGVQTISATVKFGNFIKKQEARVVIRETSLPVTVSTFRVIVPGETAVWKPAPGEWKGTPETEVRLFSSPVAGMRDALHFLNDYPYGCLEQTAAAAFPLLSAPDLVKAGLLPKAAAETVSRKIQSAYTRLLPMMLADGMFAMWPGSREPWPEATVFAAHFLFAAEKSGSLAPDPRVIKKVRSALEKIAGNAGLSRSTRAYACYVSAFAGSDRLMVEAKRLLVENSDDLAAFFAGAALVRTGFAAEGRNAMRHAVAAKCYTAELDGFGPETAAPGMVLAILMDTDPDAALAAPVAAYLQKRLRPDGSAWGVTSSNAWAVTGLARFAAAFPAAPVKAEKNGNGTPYQVRNNGTGPLFAEFRAHGLPAKPQAAGGAVKLRRNYLNEAGEPVAKAKHGDLLKVRIEMDVPKPVRNLVLCDLLPGGLEIEDARLATRSASPDKADGSLRIRRLEKLDDRLMLSGDVTGHAVFTYTVRAVTRGSFLTAPLRAEAMYDADLRGVFAAPARFTVE